MPHGNRALWRNQHADPETAMSQDEMPQHAWSLVVHGGAGILTHDSVDAATDAATRAALAEALGAGAALLERGGSALDAVETAVRLLEDDPNFNAAHGAVFTYGGKIELDAAIMDGRDRNAGAVARSHFTRNPISLARKVLSDSPHVLLSGEGADRFSRETGLEQVEPEYFRTEARWQQLQAMKARPEGYFDMDLKYGTVGAVARDAAGHVAAATSTGGLTGKRYGRIGDSPLIGAGTYADDRAGAISATGAGEYFIRAGAAHEFCARLRLTAEARGAFLRTEAERTGAAPDAANLARLEADALSDAEVQAVADAVIADIADLGGTGGIIYVTPWGHQGFAFNTPGMYRGRIAAGEAARIAIYGDER